MTSVGTGYDLSASTYSPDGKIFQIEYANKAVESSGTCIGLRAVDGIVLAVEKPVISKLLVPGENKRTWSVDDHIGTVSAGVVADAFHLSIRASKEARAFKNLYDVPIPGKKLAQRLSSYVQLFTLYSSVRPFGTNVIVGSFDADGPAIHMIESSGLCYGYRGTASGKGSQAAKTEIEKLNFDVLTCRKAVEEAAKIMFFIHDDARDKEFELEISWICKESSFKHEIVPRELLDQVTSAAKEHLLSSRMQE